MSTCKEAARRIPGGQSRWSQGKDLSWEPLRPELVVEVAYEHMQGSRFRHMAQFRRWRTDKKPSDCAYAQLEVIPPQELAAIFPQGRSYLFCWRSLPSSATRAIPASDHHLDREPPAVAEAPPARDAG